MRASLAALLAIAALLVGGGLLAAPPARADTTPCNPDVERCCAQGIETVLAPGQTTTTATPVAPSPGKPCWVDYATDSVDGSFGYPFGSDGNPVDLRSDNPNLAGEEAFCDGPTPPGPNWTGDFGPGNGSNQSPPSEPPCYLEVSSFAFRAWNRGLAATTQPTVNSNLRSNAPVAFGVWLYNGTNWFPDPTFPGSAVCSGSTVLWAGKLDYWLIGSASGPQLTLCRFDGVNLQWEPLSLPAATLARLPVTQPPQTPQTVGGITSGACYAWDDCWFFGTDGIEDHWDGQTLSDVAPSPAVSPWLDGDFTGAVAGTDPSGQPFGLAVSRAGMGTASGGDPAPLPSAPDGSPPAQLFGSQGGPFEPLDYTPPDDPQPRDPFTTDLTAMSADAEGDVWIAGDPDARVFDVSGDHASGSAPAPLLRTSTTGAPEACPGYDTNPFPFTLGAVDGYKWTAVSAFPDGSALATASFHNSAVQFSNPFGNFADQEPTVVDAACGQPPIVTQFRIPDPLDGTKPSIPADFNGEATAVAANASNDGWMATSDGNWEFGLQISGALAPHMYHWTDGEAPQGVLAGDDNESRPSLFTLGPPVFQVGAPTIVVTPGPSTTTTKKKKTKKVKLPPAIYSIHTKLISTGHGTYTLYLTFKVRRKVKIGVQALKGKKVVASSGVKRFTGHTGKLALELNRNAWPTGLRWLTPKA